MTRDEYDKLPSYGNIPCPTCGLKLTEPCPGCSCPDVADKFGWHKQHINKYHHNCDNAWARAYPVNKNNIGHGAKGQS